MPVGTCEPTTARVEQIKLTSYDRSMHLNLRRNTTAFSISLIGSVVVHSRIVAVSLRELADEYQLQTTGTHVLNFLPQRIACCLHYRRGQFLRAGRHCIIRESMRGTRETHPRCFPGLLRRYLYHPACLPTLALLLSSTVLPLTSRALPPRVKMPHTRSEVEHGLIGQYV